MVNYVYQFPKGYESFEAVKKVIEENLPQGCTIELAEAGDVKGIMGNYSKGKMLGKIDIKKNAYVGVFILCTSSDGENNDFMTVTEYVPSGLIRFLKNHVLGYLTNLIFPAIFGTAKKTGEEIDALIMGKFEADKLDNSVMGAIKGLGKGLGVKESSVKDE